MESINYATHFRPTTFNEVVGQDIPKSVLSKIAKTPDVSARGIFLHGSYGSGKCIDISHRVSTSKGYLSGYDLVSNLSDGFTPSDLCVEQTDYSFLPISHLYKESNVPVITLHETLGKPFTATPNHPILSCRKGSSPSLNLLKDLQPGDFVLHRSSSIKYTINLDLFLHPVIDSHINPSGYLSHSSAFSVLSGLLISNALKTSTSIYVYSNTSLFDEVSDLLDYLSIPYKISDTIQILTYVSIKEALSECNITFDNSPILFEFTESLSKIDHPNLPYRALITEDVTPNSSFYVDYVWSEILSISNSTSTVFDVTVPSTHMFMATNRVNHNTTLAKIFGKALNCSTFKTTGDICNTCDDCKESSSPSSQTYFEFDSAVAGNIDSIRSLQERLTYLPKKGQRRLVVFDEVHACLDYRTPVHTTEGNVTAKALVDNKLPRKVKSYNFSTSQVEERPITAHYNNGSDSSVKWFKCQWNGGMARVTFNHEFFVDRKPIRVEHLPSTFYADCIDYVIPKDVEQILIGTLLGDSTLVTHKTSKTSSSISKSLSNVEPTYSIHLSQGEDQLGYLRWKESVLGPLFSKEIDKGLRSSGKHVYCATTIYSTIFSKYLGLHNTKTSFKDVSSYLHLFGPWTWLTWYLDDGNYSKSGIVTISCTNIGVEGADAVIAFCKEKYGWDVKRYLYYDKRSSKPQLRLYWSKKSSQDFLKHISGLIDCEDISYKIPGSVGSTAVSEIKEDLVVRGRKVIKESYQPKSSKLETCRYNISVEETENYTLPGGLLTHNCSSQALNAMLKMLEDGIPNTIFMFCSTEDILPTIKSRCVCLEITTLPFNLIEQRIIEISKTLNKPIPPHVATLIAAKSNGHMRDALSNLQLYHLSGEEGLKTSYELFKTFMMAVLSKNQEKAQSLLPSIMLFPSVDIKNSINVFLRNVYCSDQNDNLNKLLQSGFINKLFNFFYTPVAQSALKDEFGIELLLRNLISKLCK